jgi:hypothetical protein
VELVKEKYLGNSYRHIRLMLEKEHGINISTTTIARILNSSGLSNASKKKKQTIRKKTSEFIGGKSILVLGQRKYAWFGDLSKETVLTAAIDLYSGNIKAMMINDEIDELDYLDVMRKVVTTVGIPYSVYCEDKNAIIKSKNLTIEDELAGRQYHPTSLGEALEKLDISVAFGSNDTFKRKSDKNWQLIELQLSSMLGKKGVSNIHDFNKFTDLFTRLFNESSKDHYEDSGNYKKPLSKDYAEVLLSPREKLEVVENSVIYLDGKLFRITAPDGRPAGIRPGNKVTVHSLLNKNKEIVSYRGAIFELRELNTLAGVKR